MNSDCWMSDSWALFRDPGWPARIAHWSEDENQKTDWLRPRSVYKTPSKTRRRTEDPYLKPRQLAIHEDRRHDPPSAERSPGQRAIWAGEWNGNALEKRSTTVRITVLPFNGGSPETKSRAICDDGREGMGKGLRRPSRGRFTGLHWARVEQANINCLKSADSVGH